MTNFDLLLNPPREPSTRAMAAIDRMSLTLPLVAAALAAFAGAAALIGAGLLAALLSIAAGCVAGVGAYFTNRAWQVRDGRHAVTHSLAGLALGVADRNAPTTMV